MPLGLIATALAWWFALWTAYVKVPNARRLLADFGLYVDPASRALLEYADLTLLALACGAVLLMSWKRSRWVWTLALLGTPFLAGSVLYLVSDLYVHKLMGLLS
jgi:hypothetical protein